MPSGWQISPYVPPGPIVPPHPVQPVPVAVSVTATGAITGIEADSVAGL